MTTRAEAAEATRRRVLDATVTLAGERPFAEITLDAVAERASVSVKTVLRHFGSRDALVESALKQAYDEVMAERVPPRGDCDAALTVLIDHYEKRGGVVLAMLADENAPRAERMTTTGRMAHREWVEAVFGERLPGRSDARSRLIDVLVVATDVYAWKLLRLDRGLSVEEVHDRMAMMTAALLAREGTP